MDEKNYKDYTFNVRLNRRFNNYFYTHMEIKNNTLFVDSKKEVGKISKYFTQYPIGKYEFDLQEIDSIYIGVGYLFSIPNIFAILFLVTFYIYAIFEYFNTIISTHIVLFIILTPLIFFGLLASILYESVVIKKKDGEKFSFPIYQYGAFYHIGKEETLKKFFEDIKIANQDIKIYSVLHLIKNILKAIEYFIILGIFLYLNHEYNLFDFSELFY